MKKPSFLERLTGSVNLDALEEDTFEEQGDLYEDEQIEDTMAPAGEEAHDDWHDTAEEPQDGELAVDMYQTGDAIVIRALVAGVNPEDLDIAITRDMVTLKGVREEIQEAPDEDYYHRELFWGSFSRTILLPEEVIIDEAEAKEKHGLLEISLPKLDKDRRARLTVKSHHK
ncbi:MAG: Hsp20/alpha crystallin family protein [Candidatus Pacebacteria bacterium]|nr:Hsp20/alpha crystallin family protein [Candidatus Paceibacterota bacterium]